MSIVSNNIKYLRRMNGLTQEQFARKIGIKRSLLGAYEEARANPNLDNLMNIAKIFGTTVDNLLKNDLRRLREGKGVPLPQPSPQLALKDEPEPPKQLSALIDKYYRPSGNNTNLSTNTVIRETYTDVQQVVQPIAFQPVKSPLFSSNPAPLAAPPIPATIPQVPAFTNPSAPTPSADKSKQNIEWVRQADIAEYLSSYAYPEYLKQLPGFQLPMLPQGKYRAFEAGADFAYPGAVIVGQFVNNWYDIRDGQQYVLVVHKQGVLYRRVYNMVKIKGTLLLSSDNSRISTIEVSIKEVLEVWEAKVFINHTMPEPSAMPSLDRLQEMVQALQQEIDRLKK